MKTKIMWAIILLLLATNVVSFTKRQRVLDANTELALYKNYYKGAEELLDTLENHFNWVDAIDVESYYDAVDELDHSK